MAKNTKYDTNAPPTGEGDAVRLGGISEKQYYYVNYMPADSDSNIEQNGDSFCSLIHINSKKPTS